MYILRGMPLCVQQMDRGEVSGMREQLGTNLAEVGTDCISRQQAIDKFIDGLEEIFADLRERHVDDSVCGLCEYDGAYVGQSGEWCNECPGFDRDDCFKLSDKTRKEWTEEIIKALTPIQPDNNSEKPNSSDTISRQQAIDALRNYLVGKNVPCDGTLTCRLIENEVINKLPPVQPDLSEYSDKLWQKAYERGKAEAQAEIVRCKDCRFNT